MQIAKERIFEIFKELGIAPIFYNIDKDDTEFFSAYNIYNKENMQSAEADKFWASLYLGLQIYHCILKQGSCFFEAEI